MLYSSVLAIMALYTEIPCHHVQIQNKVSLELQRELELELELTINTCFLANLPQSNYNIPAKQHVSLDVFNSLNSEKSLLFIRLITAD